MRLLQPCKNVHIARVLPIFHHSILPVQRFSSEESKCYGKRKEKMRPNHLRVSLLGNSNRNYFAGKNTHRLVICCSEDLRKV